jgi:hypothetical protein
VPTVGQMQSLDSPAAAGQSDTVNQSQPQAEARLMRLWQLHSFPGAAAKQTEHNKVSAPYLVWSDSRRQTSVSLILAAGF